VRKYDIKTEVTVLGSICNSQYEDRKYKYLGLVKEEHFGSKPTQEIFKRVVALTSEGQKIPSFSALSRDPRLSEAAKQLISSSASVRFKNEADFSQGIKTLTLHFKGRQLADLHNKIAESLNAENVEDGFETLEGTIEHSLFKMRADGVEEKIWTGQASSTEMSELVKKALARPNSGSRFKTGWSIFDENIGGLEPGNVMLLTANTGGGKSVAALTLMVNMFRLGYNISYISLEMNEEEVMARLISNATGIAFEKIHKGTLNAAETVEVERQMERFHNSSTGSYRIYSPKQDYTIEQLFNQVQSAKNNVIILDYLGLVKPGAYGKNTSEEFQLRQMTRFAKRAAERMGCAVVLLAQLNDEGQIMYSKGIGHHVHYWLKWAAHVEDIERGFVVVENGKSRNSAKRDLYFTTDFAHMRMDNIERPAMPEAESSQQGQQGQRPQRPGHQPPRKPGTPPPKSPARPPNAARTRPGASMITNNSPRPGVMHMQVYDDMA
jgi:replicative DNA helicase